MEAEGVQLEAQVTPAEEVDLDWYAEDPTIVHVTSDGFVIPMNPGTTIITATVCEGISDTITVTVEDVAHVHTAELMEEIPATCTESGLTEGSFCADCLETLVSQRLIPAAGHQLGEAEFVWAEDHSTCDAVRTCGTCGEEIAAACNITTESSDATCTEPGKVVYTATVTVDGITYTDEKTVENAALGHTEETVPGKDATCTEPGLTEGKKCTVCGDVLTAQEEIPAAGHTEETIPGKDVTCTEPGLTEGKKCSVCGEVLTAQEEIPAKGHSYGSAVTVPTCTEQGYTTHTCSACGNSYVDTYVDAVGHSFEDGFCTECGAEDPDYEEPTEPEQTVPSTPVKPSVPGWSSWLKKIWEKILEPIKPFLPGFGSWRK